jgi:formamidopyrimidine-DNA glycosylase
MAEVPEVETLVRDLREAVVGRTVLETNVLQPAAVRLPTVDEFTNLLTERVFLAISCSPYIWLCGAL